MKTSHNTIELLAPAGSFQGFLGALNGGADAVYLAGDKFGARAYADNFSEEEMAEALFLAKLFGIKVYLTVNTLLKNKEIQELYDYIKPLYEMGLTGVIIQDFGVLKYIKEHFPGLELHASTQMTVTSLEGAEYLKSQGVKRVVLSRELTLKEIETITQAGIETECFIHGSMCYCYSGQCLFSSLIGGRSGNRGRCAQPCRLPYKAQDSRREEYFLSLKDMCTLEHLPELIESGIASFKIEGRMKNPAYAAWVTAIYRKYIDLYLADPEADYRVDSKDLEQLKTLYIRTELQDGYYHKYRGKNMITPDSPAYSKTDEAFVADITEKMIHSKPKKEIALVGNFTVGQPCMLTAALALEEDTISVCVSGDEVLEAMKAPLTEESIRDRLAKMGDSYFCAKDIRVKINGNVFLPVKALNELRRKVLDALKEEVLKSEKGDRVALPKKIDFTIKEALNYNCETYIGFAETEEQYKELLQCEFVSRLVIPYGWLLKNVEKLKNECEKAGKSVYFSLPAICRNDSFDTVREALEAACDLNFGEGVYTNQVDSVAFVKRNFPDLKCIGDINLYGTNNEAVEWLKERIDGYTVSVELNKDELRHMNLKDGEMILYGRTPLMHSANCIFLTKNECRKNADSKLDYIKDRKNAKIPYRGHCEEKVCYNTVYNSVVTSLHKHKNIMNALPCTRYQLRFTTENREETAAVLEIYRQYAENKTIGEVDFEYTNGHFLRGVQ